MILFEKNPECIDYHRLNFSYHLLQVQPDFVEDICAIALKIEILDINTDKTSDGQIKLSLMIDGEYLDLITSTLDFR